MTNNHDSRYKKLFSHPEILKQLMQNFVKESFVVDLDFSTSERIDKSFVTDEFRKKESDLIYKVKYRGRDVYIYILLEFQSSVDKFMALRMLRYICEFYEHLPYSGVKKLPAVFPVLLYNGSAKWTSKLNINELIQHHIPEKFIPNFSYYPIIENEIQKDVLFQIKNALSAIFYIETSNADEIIQNLQKILDLLRKERPDIIRLFTNWCLNIFRDEDDEFLGEIYKLKEFRSMLRDSMKELKKKLFEKGIEKGIEKGKLEGKLEGKNEGIEETTIKTARKMFKLNFSLKDISAVTGLSIEEIKEILD